MMAVSPEQFVRCVYDICDMYQVMNTLGSVTQGSAKYIEPSCLLLSDIKNAGAGYHGKSLHVTLPGGRVDLIAGCECSIKFGHGEYDPCTAIQPQELRGVIITAVPGWFNDGHRQTELYFDLLNGKITDADCLDHSLARARQDYSEKELRFIRNVGTYLGLPLEGGLPAFLTDLYTAYETGPLRKKITVV